MRAVVAVLLALLLGCASAPPRQDLAAGWQALAPGLRYRAAEPGLHALVVDLQQRRLQLSRHEERGRTLTEFSAARQALAVINVSFFDRAYRPRGITVSDAEPWPELLGVEHSPLLACDAAQRCRLDLDPPYELPPQTRTALAGTPWLIRAGVPRTVADDAACAALCAQPHPRTALGLSADGRHLIVLLAEGRRAGLPGLTLAETARQLLALGAHEALNLDGGGSSSLLIRGESAMQRPANEPALRRVANALLIL